MELVITYFEHMPTIHRTLILGGGIALFWIIENAIPFARFDYSKWKHAGVNFFFTGTTIVVNLLLAFALVMVSVWVTSNDLGLIARIGPVPIVLTVLIGMTMLDLIGAYVPHILSHKVRFLWRFHLIHHSDPQVDTTTANRHHPGESILRVVFTCMAIAVVGAPLWMIFMYQSLSVLVAQFGHANIFLPRLVDNILSWVIVTPNMHHVHHHYAQPFTDSNYANIFAFWDRLFGTFRRIDAHELRYGINTHMDATENGSVTRLLTVPFRQD